MTDTLVPTTASRARPDDSALRQLLAGLTAVRGGDFGTRLPQVGDELMDEIALVFNGMIDQLALFTSEVTRVAREVGSEGKLGGQAEVPGVSGSWKDLTDNVNAMAGNLTGQVRDIAQVATAVARGDLSQKITVQARGEILELKNTINTMVDQLSSFADEVTRVAREVGTEGQLGGQAEVPGVSGSWKDLTDNVNAMAGNLTGQVRDIAQVATAVARGDLSQKITVQARGEILELKNTINTMVDQLSSFADEVTRVAREVVTDGRLGGQADVKGVSGTWRDLTESVNVMAGNLTDQVRSIAQVTTAVAQGDLSQKIRVDARGEILELKETINTMVDQLSAFADEVTRVAREVGTQGNLGGQANVRGVSGIWKDLTDNVNVMASNLTAQVRSIAQVATGVARGDLSQKITVEAKGEVAALTSTINTMVDTLGAFADEVTRVAREVGTDGRLGGQASVKGVSGTWKDLTDNVNFMANNLTSQVRNIAQVTTAVAQGDLTRKIDVDARGEILELKETINTMVDQLSSFAAEVTRVAREVGTDGALGGQAEVEGVSGTWKRLTQNVNELAGNLTRQVRAIAAVTSAVATGDLTRSITVDAQGEVAELKDNINAMVLSLRDTTRMNQEQDWLKTNLAHIAGLMQGHRDLATVAQLVIDELTPMVGGQHGTFFLVDSSVDTPAFDLIASYGYQPAATTPRRFGLGESLIGQAARTRRTIVVEQTPPDYITIGSSVGRAAPAALVVLPILFEDQALGVIELASFNPFTAVHHAFLDQLTETIGVNVNTIVANARTDALLEESQRLAGELRARSEELQSRQEDLQRSNDELEVKADLLAQQNHDIEVKNREIEQARQELEERARQLALASKYKSEFLANMSHELRTPLNSLLILAGLLARNPKGNLTAKQVEYAHVIHSAGSDLLQLINDILDLSKVEAGKMDLHVEPVALAAVVDDLRATFTPVTTEKGLRLKVEIAPDVPGRLLTDRHRLAQILRNLLSNAVKFTEQGRVELTITMMAPASGRPGGEHVLFAVTDTGIGIAEENLDRIFGAFQQGDGTTSRRYGGTGLGLSICREVATLLGGEIRARSVYGSGSTFTLDLPTNPPAELTSPEPPRDAVGSGVADAISAGASGAGAAAASAVAATLAVAVETVAAVPAALDPAQDTAERTATDATPTQRSRATARPGTFGAERDRVPVARDRTTAQPPGVRTDRPNDGPPRTVPVPSPALPGTAGPALPGTAGPALPGTAGEPAGAPEEEDILVGRSVLVVDDDVRNVFAITSILEFYGASVDHAPDGRKGIEKLLANPSTDLVLMDVMMPEMDGYTTMAAIRAMTRFTDLPIIAVTAKAMPDDRQKCLDAGANEYVTKPVDVDELLARVQDVLAPPAAGPWPANR
ncbi:HAMP domain-containing protein [Pseudofrankia inefficax]|uniref:Circadian input-output histidine kinase CikA n=1 Tax=Pseudofrankia inefficax (strain DSM 45817 / CECT 9037 / DDB 130130 / EuI1c) TaxID=298654 RepID=E3JDG9_PSEI1|nr:HAMP domain-containing protein [Pseudofrankia inefficax]ADP83602.1 GAF sensor hybrid histidine kinase [Pseudofrankia inefficax]